MKTFSIPTYYRSSVVGKVKTLAKQRDPRKKDFKPVTLDVGPVVFYLARHFGFCYGVENAIEISYRALEENPDKRIYMVSQMIHNRQVNDDLASRGVRFILDTMGRQLIPWEQIAPEDIVITPAFGATLETEQKLSALGVDVQRYNTTCPFVEKVWNRAARLGQADHTVIIHGKMEHEETRSTFSHTQTTAPSVIVRNIEEARLLGEFIRGNRSSRSFYKVFAGKFSPEFDVNRDLQRIGVVNQTTMLAKETQAIADYFRQTMIDVYGGDHLKDHFADTRDTLCYATNDNQEAAYSLHDTDADMAVVVGGYNSSNTAHIAMLCQQKFMTYLVHDASDIKSREEIHHFDFNHKIEVVTRGFLPTRKPLRVALTSGASCPDTVVDAVMLKTLQLFEPEASMEDMCLRMGV